jgi:hypothetical protein
MSCEAFYVYMMTNKGQTTLYKAKSTSSSHTPYFRLRCNDGLRMSISLHRVA